MKRILLTGMSGKGKSSLALELAARGYRAVDLDEPEWSETAPDGEWVWREDRVRALLATEDGDVLFVAGCASNHVKFYREFDEIILLSAPADVIIERLAIRTNNPFGKSPGELAQVLDDLKNTEPMLRRVAGNEVATTAPPTMSWRPSSGSCSCPHSAAPPLAAAYPSTGRISIVSIMPGHVLTRSTAACMSGTFRMPNPPICSLVSANGPRPGAGSAGRVVPRSLFMFLGVE